MCVLRPSSSSSSFSVRPSVVTTPCHPHSPPLPSLQFPQKKIQKQIPILYCLYKELLVYCRLELYLGKVGKFLFLRDTLHSFWHVRLAPCLSSSSHGRRRGGERKKGKRKKEEGGEKEILPLSLLLPLCE